MKVILNSDSMVTQTFKMADNEEEQDEEQPPQAASVIENICQGILNNDKAFIEELLNDESEIDINERDEDGRTPIDLAVILGRNEILEMIIKKCNSIPSNSSGYSPLHLCATWGRLECLRILINRGGGDFHAKTRHNEDVQQLALRYANLDCVEFIKCTEAREVLKEAISSARETLSNAEKIAGKWHKEEKTKVTGLCNEKTDWLDKNPNATLEETTKQTVNFEERYEPYLAKLNH